VFQTEKHDHLHITCSKLCSHNAMQAQHSLALLSARHHHFCYLLVDAGVEPLMTHPDVCLWQLEQVAESHANCMCSLLIRTVELTSLLTYQHQTYYVRVKVPHSLGPFTRTPISGFGWFSS